MTDYIRWDTAKNEAIRFERQGECNRCGACCKAMIRFKATVHPELGANVVYQDEDIRNGGDSTDGEGIWNEVVNENGDRRFFKFTEIDPQQDSPCSELSGDGFAHTCAIQFDKNLLCRSWPMAPEHVTPFPECSYTFVEIDRWKIDEKK